MNGRAFCMAGGHGKPQRGKKGQAKQSGHQQQRSPVTRPYELWAQTVGEISEMIIALDVRPAAMATQDAAAAVAVAVAAVAVGGSEEGMHPSKPTWATALFMLLQVSTESELHAFRFICVVHRVPRHGGIKSARSLPPIACLVSRSTSRRSVSTRADLLQVSQTQINIIIMISYYTGREDRYPQLETVT
jgi:hypothetical protein